MIPIPIPTPSASTWVRVLVVGAGVGAGAGAVRVWGRGRYDPARRCREAGDYVDRRAVDRQRRIGRDPRQAGEGVDAIVWP